MTMDSKTASILLHQRLKKFMKLKIQSTMETDSSFTLCTWRLLWIYLFFVRNALYAHSRQFELKRQWFSQSCSLIRFIMITISIGFLYWDAQFVLYIAAWCLNWILIKARGNYLKVNYQNSAATCYNLSLQSGLRLIGYWCTRLTMRKHHSIRNSYCGSVEHYT